MFCPPRYSRLLKSIAFTMLAAGLSLAQRPAGPNRPASVPADYLVTPFGYFHSSCVQHLAKGDEVRGDEKAIRHADGTVDNIQACALPHFKADGTKIVGDERGVRNPSIGHAWVEYASTRTTTSYGILSAYWNVPPAPSSLDGQTIYIFPGMEDYSDAVTIIQPVLGWNSDYANAWGIASWNCCVNGVVVQAPPAHANSGDVIFGYMADTCASGTLSCPTWDIVTMDLTNKTSSRLLKTSSFGQTFNWAFAGALEVYDVVKCTDYPSGGSTSFYDLGLFNYQKAKLNPVWTMTNLSAGRAPRCGNGAALPKQLTLTY